MPLPWKRTKTNRISRIVADLQPPSRGASLVVETGFPASVIDLFVKNRDRIKRQSFKKRRNKQYHALDICESVAPPPTPSLSPDNSLRLAAHEAVVIANCSEEGEQMLDNLQGGQSAPREVQVQVVGGGANANANGRGSVFVLAVKMFLVVLPALSTKKLALGITLSAFLLLLLEIFGNFAVGFFRPCSDAGTIRKRFFSESETTAAERQGESIKRDDGLIDGSEEEEPNPASEEIQILESNFTCSSRATDYEDMGEEHDLVSREKRWDHLDVEVENEDEQGKLRVGKNERSRSAKLKAKIIKKLIPKKLRSGKRMKTNKKESKEEVCSEVADHDRDEQEKENGSASSCEEEEEGGNGVWGVHQSWHHPAEMGIMGKGGEEERNNMECIFVVVMILWGLLGGRIVAVVVSVSGCLILKILNQKWKWKLG